MAISSAECSQDFLVDWLSGHGLKVEEMERPGMGEGTKDRCGREG